MTNRHIERPFGIWANHAHGGQWLTWFDGDREQVRSFDTVEEATAFLLRCGWPDSTEVKRGVATAYAAHNPRYRFGVGHRLAGVA